MNMRRHMIDIYNVFISSETLLRLLYYRPVNQLDDPLSPTKPNILDMNEEQKWRIINDRISTVPKVDDLDTEEKCRLLFYPGKRISTDNYLFSDQEIVVDILCHFYFNDVDLRLSWICDVVNELMFDKRLTGIGKIEYKSGNNISAPKNYLGYRLIYVVGSRN